MNIFFGTDGWRAHIDTEINEETVSIAAQAFADFIHRDYKENLLRGAGLRYPQEFTIICHYICRSIIRQSNTGIIIRPDRPDTRIILCHLTP